MSVNTRATASNSIPSDNTLRYYRLAIPVTRTAYEEDLGGNYNNVLQFWRECEEFANRMFVPLGICFNVIEDQRLVKTAYFPNEGTEDFIYTLQSNGTSNTNDLIGENSYDVGMWVYHRDIYAENSGLSAEGGVYSSIAKGSGYSKTDKWVVAHEIGHLFGAPHTTTGEGSLMDSGGDDFFSYPSIKKIRDLAVERGAGSANNAVEVSNSAPVFNNMKDSYRIPQGACIAIPVYANDADGNMLTYSAIGCSSSTVGNVKEGGYMPHFASLIPQTSNVIDYRPKFTADIYSNGDYYYKQSGTDIPAMSAGSYNIAILVNDVPASMEYDYLTANPFYSNYAVWDATVQIVGGTSFSASMSPAKNSYSAGEQVTVSWGVNSNYFTADSRLRITMSTDYGKTFAYVLADNVPALDGNKVVTLPNVNVGNIDVDFKTATRSKRGGIIRVEEIGGVAYTLTTLDPTDGKDFNITGGSGAPITYTISVTAGDGGTATIGGKSSTTVTAGSSVTLSATPNDGYIFDGWYSGGSFVSLQTEYTFTPTASGTYEARFEEAGTPVTYKITAAANPETAGSVTGGGTYNEGATVTLTATPNSGYEFVNWTKGGTEVSTSATYSFTANANADYVANFKEETQVSTYTITATANPIEGGTATVNGKASVEVEANGTIELSAKANDGYKFVNWTNGGKEVTTQADYIINNVAGDADYIANFEPEVQDVLTTGYYHLVSRATDRNEHLYNNAFSSGNTYHFTLQSNTMVNTNNGIWYITKNGNQLGIKNGDGKPVVAGKSDNASIMGTFSNLNIHTTINNAGDGYTYYYFNEALNCSDSNQNHFKVGGINYLTTWSNGGAAANDNQWRFEPVDMDGMTVYDVVVECTENDVYVTYGSEYAFNGGFFITNETITAQQLTAKKNNAAVQDVTVLVEGKTIRVVDTEYVDITVSTTPPEGGTATINGEATGTKSVIKGSEVTLTATPAEDYEFVNWTKGGIEVSTNATYNVTITEASDYVANFEAVKDGLTTGYYHIVSRVTTSHEYLYNNALRTNNSNEFTLQADSKITTNNGIWYITVNSNQLGVKNGDGNALVTGAAYCGDATSHNTLNIVQTTDVGGVTYYSFVEGINCTNRTQYNFTLEGNYPVKDTDNNYVTTWTGHPDDQANQWRFERVDTEDKNIYDVVVDCTDKDVYVTYGSEYAFNGGFFITNETITAQQLTAKKGDVAAQGVTVLVEGNTIRVVDTEYVDITVSTTPPEGGSVTINGEAESTLQVVKSSNVTVVATPADGYHFVNWNDAGSNAVSTDATYTFTASKSTSLTANFEADVVYHTITVSTFYDNDGGTVKVGEENATSVNVADGESVRMLATVKEGYEFMGWLKDGVIVKNAIGGGLDFEVQGPDYTLYEIKASAEYVAVFSKITDYTNLEDGKAYRIRAVSESCEPRYIYREGTELKWKNDDSNFDDNSIFVVQKNGNSVNLISAIGYHGWKASNILGNDEQYNHYAAIKVTYGTKDETRSLYLESGTSSGIYTTLPNNEFAFVYTQSKESLPIMDADNRTTNFLFEEVDTYAFQVSVADGSNAKLGTINLPFATTVHPSITAYAVTGSDENYAYVAPLTLEDNILPANTPVLVEAEEAGTYGFAPAPASNTVYETGFAGTLGAKEIADEVNAYILSYKGAGTAIKLYKLASDDRTINANKAYYIDETGSSSAISFKFVGTTDIDGVESEDENAKGIYDLQGRKLSEITEPGIYIVDGKKIMVK